MMKDKVNRTLVSILVVLAVLYAISFWTKRGSSGSQVFRTHLVNIDTTRISDIHISTAGDKISLSRQGNSWTLVTEKGAEVSAMGTTVRSMLSSLQRLVPSRVVSRDPTKWRDYQVDSTGRRIQILENGEVSLDLVVGRTNFQGQQTFVTYVRPYGENNVYAIENFSGSVVSASSSNYRDKSVLTTTLDSLHLLDFKYTGKPGYTLQQVDGNWWVEDNPADSTLVADYLNGLRRITSSSFEDMQQPAASTSPSSSLIIHSRGEDNIVLRVYDGTEGKKLLHSSQNPESYFSDTAVINKIFVEAERFTK